MFLPAIRGQEIPRAYFQRVLEQERLSHAYLFLGPPESQRELFALELAKAVFCPTGQPCGTCAQCRAVDSGNHAGVGVYRPPEGKRAIDIDTIRAVCERSHFRRDHAFIAMIESADTMAAPAANALLKTLEEPAGEFVIILMAESTGSMLPTIVSRAHRMYFSAPDAPGDDSDESSQVVPEVLAEAEEPRFFVDEEVREWLTRAVPGASTARDRARALIDAYVRRERDELATIAAGSGAQSCFDVTIDTLGELLELRGRLDGSVNADLVVERVLKIVRRR